MPSSATSTPAADLAGGAAIRVAVIGGGIIGLLSALEIQRSGAQVTLIEPGEIGGPQSASYGNGAWVNPSAIMPMSVPGLWRKVPGYLLDASGPFVIRWRHLPALVPWLWRFLRAGSSWDKIAECARLRFMLCRDAVEGHEFWATEAGVPDLLRKTGLTFVYGDAAGPEQSAREWAMRRDLGVAFTRLDAQALHLAEPALSPGYVLGMRLDQGASIHDTRAYLAALADLLVARGGVVLRSAATGFVSHSGQLAAVATEDGPVACSRAVIAAGAWSAHLAAQAGDRVPLVSERGYHVLIPWLHTFPEAPLMPDDGKMAVTPTAQGLRIAGQVELASLDAPPDWRRCDILRGYARRMFPSVADRITEANTEQWMGHRPSTPDGLPSLGRARGLPDVIHAFGHGHSGLCQAPATARMVADLVAGRPTDIPVAALSPARFA